MAEKQARELKAHQLIALCGGMWLIGVFVGNIIGVLVSPNHNIVSFGDFFTAMGGFTAVVNLIVGIALLVAIPLSSTKND